MRNDQYLTIKQAEYRQTTLGNPRSRYQNKHNLMNNKDVLRRINFCNATLKKMKLDIIIFIKAICYMLNKFDLLATVHS